ncbi:MAG TPA: hypothetical protein VGF23_05610 [Gaiellaceae bacterium]|jgi:hypothetical protein
MRRLTVVPLLVLVVAGCGGGSSSSGGVSHADFAERGNAICSRMTSDLRGLRAPKIDQNATGAKAARQQEELQAYARRAEAITRSATDRLGKLDPPSDLKATRNEWRRTIAVLDANTPHLTQLYNEAIRAQQSGDAASATKARDRYTAAAREQAAIGQRSAALVKKLGWTACE